METKQQIRVKLKEKRERLKKEQVLQMSQKICDKLKEYIWFQQAKVIYFYYPLGKEVNLLPLAETALTFRKQIAFPKVNGRNMDFYQVDSFTCFQEGNFHVMEPTSKKLMDIKDALVFVPGIGFDNHKNRMGYGGGYYDRYFMRYPECHKIGIAYSFQIVKTLVRETHDIPMDAVITEVDEPYHFL